MAVDEALAHSTRTGISPPVLRLYRWDRPTLSLGYFQKIDAEVNRAYCAEHGIPIVRRLTGGRAILHQTDELTYSFTAPFTQPEFASGLKESYLAISGALMIALRSLGIPAEMAPPPRTSRPDRNPVCFQSLSLAEAAVDGRKIIGSAQKRWPDGLMQHGSIPMTIDTGTLYNSLAFESDEARNRAMAAAGCKMSGLMALNGNVTNEALTAAIAQGFEAAFGISLQMALLTPDEESRTQRLVDDRYGNEEWNERR
ncbi:MAG: lipoate--protein ligase family protein [Nitrospirae bacterium]|nr:lipoate--protein ligase family protein [Nitrospirota bacterium]